MGLLFTELTSGQALLGVLGKGNTQAPELPGNTLSLGVYSLALCLWGHTGVSAHRGDK